MVEARHVPVMVPEALAALDVRPGGAYVDANLGEGGHAAAILRASAPDGRLIGIDADPAAIDAAARRLAGWSGRFTAVNANFRGMRAIARQGGIEPGTVDGVLFDLGLSSLQLDEEPRGFSFRRPDPLDMRFDPAQRLTADDIVNHSGREELADLIYQFGEERSSRRIAAAIVAARPVRTASELAGVITRATPRRGAGRRLHPATRTFQALRIAVNDELGALEEGLEGAIGLLKPGGRVAVIAYHSLEDRIVKDLFRRESRDCICPPERPICECGHMATVRPVTRRVVRPSEAEVEANPRSRSARLRAVERL